MLPVDLSNQILSLINSGPVGATLTVTVVMRIVMPIVSAVPTPLQLPRSSSMKSGVVVVHMYMK